MVEDLKTVPFYGRCKEMDTLLDHCEARVPDQVDMPHNADKGGLENSPFEKCIKIETVNTVVSSELCLDGSPFDVAESLGRCTKLPPEVRRLRVGQELEGKGHRLVRTKQGLRLDRLAGACRAIGFGGARKFKDGSANFRDGKPGPYQKAYGKLVEVAVPDSLFDDVEGRGPDVPSVRVKWSQDNVIDIKAEHECDTQDGKRLGPGVDGP